MPAVTDAVTLEPSFLRFLGYCLEGGYIIGFVKICVGALDSRVRLYKLEEIVVHTLLRKPVDEVNQGFDISCRNVQVYTSEAVGRTLGKREGDGGESLLFDNLALSSGTDKINAELLYKLIYTDKKGNGVSTRNISRIILYIYAERIVVSCVFDLGCTLGIYRKPDTVAVAFA